MKAQDVFTNADYHWLNILWEGKKKQGKMKIWFWEEQRIVFNIIIRLIIMREYVGNY